jgi:hypothetical protein
MTDDDPPEGDYVVGPGRPPLPTRFKLGQKSANPLGRPKGSLNLATIVKKEGNKKINVKVGGRTRTVTKMEAAVAQQYQKAMQGNVASAKLVFEQTAKADDVQSGAHAHLVIPKLDTKAMRRMAERFLRNTEEAGDEPTSNE